MDTFLLNAQRIFDVACAESSADFSEFALLVRRDGGIHMIMESQTSLPAVMAQNDVQAAYRVERSRDRTRVTGSNGNQRCQLEETTPRATLPLLLRDQPLYRITSPLLITATE